MSHVRVWDSIRLILERVVKTKRERVDAAEIVEKVRRLVRALSHMECVRLSWVTFTIFNESLRRHCRFLPSRVILENFNTAIRTTPHRHLGKLSGRSRKHHDLQVTRSLSIASRPPSSFFQLMLWCRLLTKCLTSIISVFVSRRGWLTERMGRIEEEIPEPTTQPAPPFLPKWIPEMLPVHLWPFLSAAFDLCRRGRRSKTITSVEEEPLMSGSVFVFLLSVKRVSEGADELRN